MTGPLIRVNKLGPADRKRENITFWQNLAPAVVRAVEQSLLVAKIAHLTKNEVRRRTDMAKKLAEQMHYDYQWSRQRITDLLPVALSARLVGLEFDLEALARRSTW